MLYPIIWMIGASFKSNNEIFTSIGFVPSTIDFQAYIDGWDTKGDYTFTLYFINTFKYVIPKIVLLLFQQLLQRTGLPDLIFRLKSDVLTFDGNDVFTASRDKNPLVSFWNRLDLLDTYIPLLANSFLGQEPFLFYDDSISAFDSARS